MAVKASHELYTSQITVLHCLHRRPGFPGHKTRVDYDANFAISRLPGKRCRPGTFYCQKLAAKGKPDVDAVFTCGLDGVGRLSALCGYGGCCTEFPDKGTAYCTCFTDPGDLPELEPTISPREVDAATGPNSVIAPQADCTPGEYVCLQLPGRHGPKGSAVHVCTAEHKWQLSAFCGGINCCEEGSIPGTAYCTCANDEGTLIKRTTLPPAANPDVASSASECTPGTFKCGLLYDRVAPIGSAVFACNLKGLWVQSANCGPLNCCQQGPTPETAFCTCGRPSTSEVSSGPTDESSSLRLRATSDVTETSLAECTPGNFKCDFLPVGHGDNNSGRMRVAIFACSPEGNWRVSAVCDCCRHGPQPGTAYCYCLPSAEQSSLPAGEDTLSKRATLPRGEPESDVTTTEAECTPAIYKCEPVGGWPPNNLFTAIYTCDALGYWQFSVVCPGGPECCREGRSRKTAHCTCGPALQDLPELQNRSLSVSRRQNPNPDDLVDDNGRSPGRCTPGTYMCQYSKSQPTQSHVTVCTPVGECRISASCGPAHCCQRGGPGAFCVCKNPKAHALEIDPTSIVSELGDVSSDTQSLLKRQKPPTVPTCIPGTSFCAKGVVYNCDSNGKSTPSVRCGSSDDCCQRGAIPGTAYCVCGASAMEQLSNEEKISLEEEQFSIAEHEAVQDSPSANSKREASPQEKVPFNSPQGISKCQPGYSYCIDGTIHNCNIAGNLIMSVQCGRNPDCCITGPTPGTAFCVCGAGSIEQLSTEKQLSIEGQSMTLSTVKAVPTKA
ncbi:hypothetical protein M011DRAFT_466081 [Sporormia fimetaria CBS 119925]|uniref:Uncharacterized protein n=1 Tax=Sporormia fimetaria CBS 119925 TaxID=1340428 RepID=A0A6A6VED6_9PLEO|nr:hypothetical protein M011DRAFT_466081 [Sporormia fimetaria CBS 119925]